MIPYVAERSTDPDRPVGGANTGRIHIKCTADPGRADSLRCFRHATYSRQARWSIAPMPRRSLVAGLIVGSLAAIGGGVTPLSNVTTGHTSVTVTSPPDRNATRLPEFREQPKLRMGVASWYGGPVFHQTANGEPFRANTMTAASRSLPFNTHVRVTNLLNRRSVVVRINDRGPYVRGRVIDLTPKAAAKLDMKEKGVAPVSIEIVRNDPPVADR